MLYVHLLKVSAILTVAQVKLPQLAIVPFSVRRVAFGGMRGFF